MPSQPTTKQVAQALGENASASIFRLSVFLWAFSRICLFQVFTKRYGIEIYSSTGGLSIAGETTFT